MRPTSVRSGPYRRAMTDPGIVAALGIEAVEWLDEADDRVTVRISGRWRRRPTSPGQPWLVVESLGERHRYPAMPEPPGLTGMMPGTWRMTFRLPMDVARSADVRAWLQLGAVLVPLPSEPALAEPRPPAEPAAPAAEPAAAAEPAPALPSTAQPIPPLLAPRSVGVFELQEEAREEQLRETERALEAERARTTAAEAAAADLAVRLAELGHELERSETDATQLTTTLAERDRSLRDARQRAHAEEMVRLELARERDQLDEMLEASRVRVRGLEDEVTDLRRRADEAEHEAAAARRASPPPALPAPVRSQSRRRARVYAAECRHAQAARVAGADAAAAPSAPRRPPARPVWSVRERELVALRIRLAMRPHGPDLAATVEALRGELAGFQATAEREREARSAAEAVSERLRHQLDEHEARSERAFAALDELRDQIEWVRRAYLALGEAAEVPPSAEPPGDLAADVAAVAPPQPEAQRNGGFRPDRLDAARTRLREQTPMRPEDEADEADEPAEPPADTRPPFTLAPLAGRNPERAGNLLLKLLPAQGIVHPDALAYDLVLDPGTCVRVTVADGGATEVNWMHTPRARADVRFQLVGDPASIIRLLTAGALRRRLRWGHLAKVHGDRSGVSALRSLAIARLSARELDGAGVARAGLDPDGDAKVRPGGGDEPQNRATSG